MGKEYFIEANYAGNSELVAAFLSIHRELTETIDRLCAADGLDVLKNHAADALECLISTEPDSLAPLDHLLGLRIQNHIALFGPMTFVRAVAAEYDLDFVVEEYQGLRKTSAFETQSQSRRYS